MQRRVQPMDRKMMQQINQNTLLNLIRTHAPVSRTALKNLSGLSQGTIVGITASLIEQQLVIETGTAQSTGGRKAELLEIYPDGRYVIGLDLREYEIIAVLMNLHGDVIFTRSWPVLLRHNASQAISLIVEGVQAFIDQAPVQREKIIGLGCGVPGPIDTELGQSIDSWMLGWHNVELTKPLSQDLQLPVFVDNTVNCRACYEKLYGSGQDYNNFLLITLGRGLGLATVIGNKLFRGARGIGAEFGHIPFESPGRLCECGNYGCLEAYIANHGILKTYHDLLAKHGYTDLQTTIKDITVEKVSTLALEGDVIAHETLALTGTYLGQGLATLINLFNPECLIICSDGAYDMNLLTPAMYKTMKQHVFSQLDKNMDLLITQDSTAQHWAQGAGSLVLQNFFSVTTPLAAQITI